MEVEGDEARGDCTRTMYPIHESERCRVLFVGVIMSGSDSCQVSIEDLLVRGLGKGSQLFKLVVGRIFEHPDALGTAFPAEDICVSVPMTLERRVRGHHLQPLLMSHLEWRSAVLSAFHFLVRIHVGV